MDRLFLDANVLFSAAYRSEAGVRRLWALEGATLMTSAYTLEEARRNLTTESQQAALEVLACQMEIVPQPPIHEALESTGLPDKDLPVLAAAIAGSASHLITGDQRHFGPHFGSRVEGVLILRPAAYLRSSP